MRPPSGLDAGRLRRGWAPCLLVLAVSLASTYCSNVPLQRVPPPVKVIDNELEIQGEVCPTPPADAVFPVKVLFLVDVSGSLIVTDPADVRVQAVSEVIQKYQGLP